MKKRGRRFLCVCLTAALMMTLLVSPAGLAAETREISFSDGGVYVYDGSPQEPDVTVTKDGAVLAEGTYTVGYRDNTDAGTAVAVVTALDGSWTAEKSFVIHPKELGEDDLFFDGLCVKAYDRTNTAQPKIEASVLGSDRVSVTYTSAAYDDKFVGKDKVVTVRGLSLTGADSENYTLPGGLELTGNVGQITAQTLRVTQSAAVQAGGKTLTLVTGARSADFSFNTADLGCSINNGILTSGDTPGKLEIFVQSLDDDVNDDGVPEYYGGSGTIQVTILVAEGETTDSPDSTEQGNQNTSGVMDQPNLVLSGGTSVTYGQNLRFSVSGGAGSGPVTYGVLPVTGDGTIDSSGLFTPTKAGKVRITAQKAGDNQYRARTADAVEVVVQPAQVTVTVKDKSAVIGDAVPALTPSDYTVSGLVGSDKLATEPTLSYASTPDMTRAGIISIRASGGVVPNSNYAPDIVYRSGILTISALPLYGIQVAKPTNGILTVDQTSAEPGTRVTIQVKAREGYELKNLKVTGEGGQAVRVTETGEGRYTFTMPEYPVTVSADFVEIQPVLTVPFTDVKEGDWYYESVAYVYQQGLMTGTSDTAFSPNLTTTRGMIVTILYRMEGSPEAPGWAPFADVSQGKYYADPVAWAAWNGIVNGKSSTSFAPEEPITREQLAAILYRYAQFKGYDVSAQGDLSQFTDQAMIRAYALDAMSWANAEGLITGKGKGVLDPRGPATRAQVAAILQRFCEGNGL